MFRDRIVRGNFGQGLKYQVTVKKYVFLVQINLTVAKTPFGPLEAALAAAQVKKLPSSSLKNNWKSEPWEAKAVSN